MYSVQTEQFEGPLELLLDLIEREKLSINEISLANIADQYLMQVKSMRDIKPEEIATFLVIASTLMLIKSRSLLPQVSITDDEEEDIQELEHRLEIYKKFRELSRTIEELQKRGARMYARETFTDFPVIFYPPEKLSLEDMFSLVKHVIQSLPHKELLPEKTIKTIVSIEEKMEELKDRMASAMRQSFQHFVSGKTEKVDVIISFLAMLEMFKDGMLLLQQDNLFEDITMEKI